MSDLPLPEPTEEDEELALDLIRARDETSLRGRPEGEQRCDTCHFYADPGEDIAYCWHDRLGVMVGGGWWCDAWAAVGEPDEVSTPGDRQTAMKLRVELVEGQQWLDHPRSGEQCNTCRYYLSPDDSVSYCWHPKRQVGVGFDHWCQWWEEIPGEP